MQVNIEVLELSINDAKDKIKLRDDLVSLQSNRAFQRIINNGFFRDYPAELARSLADPVISGNKAKFDEVQRDFAGVSVLHGYFKRIQSIGEMAEQSLKDYQEELEEYRISGQSEE
jgi:hypothetical protein